MATVDISLDTAKPQDVLEAIVGRQGDTGTTVRVSVLENGAPYDFEGKYLEFHMLRPGESKVNWINLKEGLVQDQSEKHVWSVTLPEQATAYDGVVKLAYFVVRSSSDEAFRDSTQRFVIKLDKSTSCEAHFGPYSDQVDKLIRESILLTDRWEQQIDEQQEAYLAAEARRDEDYGIAEENRDSLYEAAEAKRNETFDESERSRQATFDSNEGERSSQSSAAAAAANEAAAAANEAANKVQEALEGDMSKMFDAYLDTKKDVEGGFPSYEEYLEGIKNAGTPDESTLTKDSSNKLMIRNSGVTEEKIADGAVSSKKIANSSVTTEKINSKAVTLAKLGDDVVAAINSKPIGLDINAYTWEELSTIIYDDSITTEILQYLVGQTRYVTLSGYGTFAFQVIGVRHDDLSDGSGKAGLTFQSVPCITTHNMNSTNVTTGGWASTSMRSWLNSTIYNAISSDLKPYVKKVKKKYCATTTYSNVSTCDDYLFLASHMEVFGQSSYGAEGTWYQYWSLHNSNDDRIKYLNNSAQWWWLRSVISSTLFWYVGYDGSADDGNASGSGGVAPCFCI